MTTPMNAYASVATRFGVDPYDDLAIDEFFLRVVPLMHEAQREEILQELLGAIGAASGGSSSRFTRELPVRIPLLPLEKPVSPVQAPERRAALSSGISIDDRLSAIIRELIGNGITLAQAVEAFEGKYIVAAMTASRGNVTQASQKLGVHRNALHNKLRSQTMLNGFAESVRPVRHRVHHKRVSAPRSPSTPPQGDRPKKR